jgi:hypothetical protein
MIDRRRRLGWLGFLLLAGLLAWGGTVDPAKATVRWIFVVTLVAMAIVDLTVRALGQIERLYLQMIMLGIAIASVAWLIPSNGSQALLAVGALLVVLPLGLWARLWLQHRHDKRNDADRPS